MKKQDLLTITKSAAISFALAAAIACVTWTMRPGQANAVNQEKAAEKAPAVATTLDGATVTGKITNPDLKTNEAVCVKLDLENPGAKPVTLEFQARLDRTDAIPVMSRRPSLPKPGWSEDYSITLKAGEKKKIEVASNVRMNAGEQVKFYVLLDNKMTSFATIGRPMMPGLIIAKELKPSPSAQTPVNSGNVAVPLTQVQPR